MTDVVNEKKVKFHLFCDYTIHGIWIFGTSIPIPFTKYYDKMINRDHFMAGNGNYIYHIIYH